MDTTEQKLRARLSELEPARERAMIQFFQLDALVGELKTLLGEGPETDSNQSPPTQSEPTEPQPG